MCLNICWKSHQQQNVQIAQIIIFLTFFVSAQRTPRNVFMWIHPQCYLPVFNQGKRFGKLDFGRYREFLVSFGVVADLKCRVGCWRNFRLTIFQKVLLLLKNSFKTRYVSDTIAVEPAFVGVSWDPQTHVHGVTSHFLRIPWKYPQYLSGLSRALLHFFPTTFLEIAVYSIWIRPVFPYSNWILVNDSKCSINHTGHV